MSVYDGPDMAESEPSSLDNGREHVIIFHDESAFHGNDFNGNFWLRPDQQVLKKKERGRLIMVSGFICQWYRNLALTDEMKVTNAALPEGLKLNVMDSRVTIYPSSKKGSDAYWDMEQMIAQVSCI